ncbi:dTMP kinase [Nesterenkonia sp. CF4.4]|uniref:dTMP kinase n=1 Tax=Nesterenkonia sp. CF4.4 TaxID=3373079 RepID=UPI003EE56085
MIVVLVGIDGAGKTTAGELLAQRLTATGYPAVFTRNSSGRRTITEWCARRNINPSVRLLDAAETSIRCVNVVLSHLRARTGSGVVIMDRHLYCQSELRRARGLDSGRFLPFLLKVLPSPDIVFHFDAPAGIAYSRVRRRAADTETLEHLQAFGESYTELAQFLTFITIDASGPTEQLVDAMMQELGMCGLELPS